MKERLWKLADIKWIKLATNVFNNRKIKQIKHMPDGNSIILVWIELLCLAGEINDNGFIYLTKEIPYTEQMMASQFEEPLATIQLALRTFEQFEMIDIIDNVLHISNWEIYQNIEGMEKVRLQNRLRKQKQRENEKLLSIGCHVTSRDSHATEEDKEKEKDIYNKSSNEDLSCLTASQNDEIGRKKVDYQQIVELYNAICKSFPRCTTLSEKRKKAISARLKTYSVDDIKKCFEKAEESNFLKGGNNRNWSANFDWLMNDSNIAKVLDGNYDNREKGGVNGNTSNHREGNTETYDEWNNLVENIYNECKPK